MTKIFVKKALIGGFLLLAGMTSIAQFWRSSVLDLSYKVGKPTFPAAAYKNISAAEFRAEVRKSFQDAGFSFVSSEDRKDGATIFQFNLNVDPKIGLKPKILVSTDALLDGKKRCNPCFLRFAEVSNAAEIKELPWIAQYDLSMLLVTAIDKAYVNIEVRGRNNLDPAFGFNYKAQWEGEKNLLGNSYVSMTLPAFKERISQAFRNAGFVPVERDIDPKAPKVDLTFIFPIDPAKEGGAVYEVSIRSQYDADGHCYPCEISEYYDPYQQLPPAGLSGVLNRATLESRFQAARDTAYESIRVDLERSLRPRSGFSVPIKSAPLGSTRPQPVPMVVT